MKTDEQQLSFLFQSALQEGCSRIADPNHLLVNCGVLSRYANGIRLPETVKIDTWDSETALFFPLHTALYQHIYPANVLPVSCIDALYCIGTPAGYTGTSAGHTGTFYEDFLPQLIPACHRIYLDESALYALEKTVPAVCSFIHPVVLEDTENHLFDVTLYLNHTLQALLAEKNLTEALALLQHYALLAENTPDYCQIGSKLAAIAGDRKLADHYEVCYRSLLSERKAASWTPESIS